MNTSLRSETLVARRDTCGVITIKPGMGLLYVVAFRDGRPPVALLMELLGSNPGLPLRPCARSLISHVASAALHQQGFNAAETQWIAYDRTSKYCSLTVHYNDRGAPTGAVWDPVVSKKLLSRVGSRRAVVDVWGGTGMVLVNFADRWRKSILGEAAGAVE